MSSNTPKVSVILPSLNVIKYIDECLNSVINQSLNDIEILCVDAGSTDGTLDIINKYIKQDERVHLLRSDKKSYGYQLNLGIDNAKGEYIGIVETDDYILDKMFETLFKIANEYKLDFIKSNFYRFINNNTNIQTFSNELTPEKQYYNRILNPKYAKKCFTFKMNTWSGLYNRNFLKKYNIRHNETPGASFQDTSFWFLTLCFADRIYFIDKYFYMNRRDNPNSSVFNSSKIYALYDEYKYIYSYLEKYNFIKKDFMPEYQYYRYKHYMSSINRSSDEKKYDFIKTISNEFKISLNKQELDLSLFPESSKSTLLKILNNPQLYYKEYKKKQQNFNVYNYQKMYAPNNIDIKRKKCKISVIIPAYNCESTIEKCIESIIKQTLKEIEIICIDDGSTDHTYTLLKELELKHNNIIVLSHNNQGSGLSRNKGISISAGEYIAFIDSDDWYPENDILETLYVKAKQNNVMICGGSFSYYKDGQQHTDYQGNYKLYTFKEEGIISYEDYQFDYGFHRFLYKTNFIKENKLFFPNLKRFQDPPFFVKAMVTAKKFYAIPKVVYCYNKENNYVKWNNEKINDVIKGVTENLEISRKYKLPFLHKLSVEHLNIDFKNVILTHLSQNNLILYELILKANFSIANDLLIEAGYKINPNNQYILKCIKQTLFNNDIKDISITIKTNNNYIKTYTTEDLKYSIVEKEMNLNNYNKTKFSRNKIFNLFNIIYKKILRVAINGGHCSSKKMS